MRSSQPIACDDSPRVVRTVVEIDAPPERVFEALTDARELADWWGGDESRVIESEADPRPGGAWQVRTVDPDGTERTFGGEYRVLDPPHHLEQTWQSSDDAEPSVVRYDLEPLDLDGTDGTRLTVTHAETVALSSINALAMRLGAARTRPTVQRQLQPAWLAEPPGVAWARRPLASRRTWQAYKQ
jgi:uncharacterized protein YndB with AHSA1/START domain